MKRKQPNFFYIYIITNLILNKQYVGSRLCYKNKIEEDEYWGSSKYLNKDYKIYGKENFKKEILKSDCKDKIEMLNEETNFILKYNTLAPNGYNIVLPTQHLKFHNGGCKVWNSGKKNCFSKETREKMRNAKLGTKRSEEAKRKTSETFKINGSKKKEKHHMWGKHLSLKHKKALITSRIGKKTIHTKETKEKMSKAKKGKTWEEIYGIEGAKQMRKKRKQLKNKKNES